MKTSHSSSIIRRGAFVAASILAASVAALGAFNISSGASSKLWYSDVPTISQKSGGFQLSPTASQFGNNWMAKNHWYIRAGSVSGTRIFSDLDSPVESTSGNTATDTWTNAGPGTNGGGQRFTAVLTTTLNEVVAGASLTVTQKLVLTNPANAPGPVTYNLFNITSARINATSGATGGLVNAGDPTHYRYVATGGDPTTTTLPYIDVLSQTASKYQLGADSTMQALLGTGSIPSAGPITDLNNTGSPSNNPFESGILQWTITLNPGESTTINLGIGVNTLAPAPPLPCPGDVNGDHTVNTIDLGVILAHFGAIVNPNTNGDCNGDGVVNTLDLGIELAAFGSSC